MARYVIDARTLLHVLAAKAQRLVPVAPLHVLLTAE
jgi:hypothetical protein